ncbi:MAG: glycoside hydrolase family 3 C-terminal domain-containing protein [Candidatus Pedobacter colombiensis]|uniref:Glycoside hydrolase family 3 C-terminal domain-containing protein n=1 Tax=Candidatus Pedobacter colombiensis TaxID=3121371 RepID=A0AAJ5WAA8_9SPHI|nr:glycoside hydrolase family 3 C-terminal domain-containing protein [Pedobacter sp.]WEK20932.1 MAG: glycoside hydrolase family 3 C-terminal domain-containing protein [Pedobacter sp.]
MNFKKNAPLLFVMAIVLSFSQMAYSQNYKYTFQNPQLGFEERVNDLVSRLTLEEKVSQMLNAAPAIPRLEIPAHDWWNEVLHGVARTPYKVTVFPQAIAMAATFDTKSLFEMADFSALEGRAVYNLAVAAGKEGSKYQGLTYWTPNINIFRDPRWGRGQETYGEDPFLTSMMGAAFVKGLQGDDPKYLKAAACAKHFAVHSGPEPLRHVFNADASMYDLWDTYLPAFKKLVVDAKVAGVMCAYNAFQNQPCCASDLFMTDILRNQWNFKGYVTSDCGAIDDFYKKHKTHKDAESAAVDAVFHGTDVDCGKEAYLALVQAVKDGKITEAQLDVSLHRLFMVRFKLGLFDPVSMVKYAQTPASVLESKAHKAHALKMAQESMVLLKNEKGLLPIRKDLKKIVVLGPNADNPIAILGNYNGNPSELSTILGGIKEKVGRQTEVVYEKAVNYTNKNVLGNDVQTDFKALVDKYKDADLFVFAGGIAPQLEGEQMKVNEPGFTGGDRTSILLPAVQTDLMKALKASGKPIVFVMMTGSAIAMPWESENIPAILNAWYGGQAAGQAVADILFGDYNPSGRLPVTFYKSDSDLPDFNNYSMENRTYRYFKNKPLYGFGYGLSYTSFDYAKEDVPVKVARGKDLTVAVRITNKGTLAGEEVAQLYVMNQNRSIKAPIKSLKGFQRLSLKAGESKIVKFELSPDDLSYVDTEGIKQQFKGVLQLSIGGSQPDEANPTSGNVLKSLLTIE